MNDTKNNTIPRAQPTDRARLALTQEQESAVLLWDIKDKEEIATALDVPPEILDEWENQPLFIVEVVDHSHELAADAQEKQAAALVFDNCSYAEAETKIGLEEGTIMQWTQDEDSNFNYLLDIMKPSAINPEYLGVTTTTPDLPDLSEDQMLAIPLIIEGKTDAQVGEAIGKSRETINRWRNQNRDFIKELEKARKAHFDSQIMALSATTQKAVTVLENLLDSEDEKIRMQVALHLLKATALPKQIG